MAVTIDDLVTPLASDGSEVRGDLIAIAGYLGLTIPQSPSEPGYQLVDMMGRWGTRLWNSRAIPAIRAQFGRFASGDWATLLWRSRGVDKNLATFGSVPVRLENRGGTFQDVSAPGAVQLAYNGKTYTSAGPAPGSTGTLGIWPGGATNYPTTILTMQADEVGSASNVPPNAFAGYPATPASAPPGVYVGDGIFAADTVTHGALVASNGETDVALLARGRAAQALASPMPVLLKFYAVALSTFLPGSPPTPVATSRVRVIPGAATADVYLATPSGPSPGDTSTPGTDVYEIDVRLQLFCGAPGLTIRTHPAALLNVNAGTLTLYVTASSGVTVAAATATAQAALDDWQSKLPIGGMRKVANGIGYVFAAEVGKIAQSQLQASASWARGQTYLPGATVTANGSAYYTATGGISATTGAGPSGTVPPPDGTITWIYQGPGASGYVQAPGVFDVAMSFVDTAVAAYQVAVIAYTIVVVIVDQGT